MSEGSKGARIEPQIQGSDCLAAGEGISSRVYRATARFPKRETYGLTSQLRRAAVSVASNIAEGQGRLTKGEFRHFLGQARGSLLELETQLEIACDLQFMPHGGWEELQERCSQVRRLLNGLIESLRAEKK